MNIWEISENRLKIIATGKGYGCIYFFLFLFGLSISSVSSLFLYSNWEKGNYPDLFLTSFFFVFGLVFISVFVNRKVINYDSVVVLDNQDKTLEYYKEEDYKIQLEYENFSHIELIKEIKYTEGKSRTAYDSYQIFLIKRDGAQFWLDSFLDADLFQEQAKKLQSFINWNMKDFSGFGLSVENKDTMRNLAGAKTYMPSKFVELKSEMEGMEIQIKKPGNFGTSFILFTIFYIFFGFPVYFLYSAFIDTKDDEVGIIFGMIALVFVSIFLSIVLLIFLLHMKRYSLLVNRKSLMIRMQYPLFIDWLFGAKMEIPVDKIRYIRVNRLDEGHIWLSLLTHRSVQYPGGLKGLLFQMGFFSRKNPFSKNTEEWTVIGLWEVPFQEKPSNNLSFIDLLFVEKTLEEQLGLEEECIEDEFYK